MLLAGVLLLFSTAALAQQAAQAPNRTPDLIGKISNIASDGSSISFGEKKKIVIRITTKTLVLLEGSKSRRQDKKLRVGQQVKIWLEDGSPDAAGSVSIAP